MRIVSLTMSPMVLGLVLGCALAMFAGTVRADVSAFVGEYAGSAEVESIDGSLIKRDMSVQISESKKGFSVQWTSTTYKSGGRTKAKSYLIDFVPSDRADVYAAAMKRNVFGHEVQLDPMKGEPYVWARIQGDTLAVFSLFVDADGGYEIQQFDRTLTDGGLMLDFNIVVDGNTQRSVSTFLERQ